MIPKLRQFFPALYLLIFVGISGYCLASDAPGLWALAMGAIAVNVWLIRTGKFVPLPRLAAAGATLLALAHATMRITSGQGTPILTIGNFLVILHLVKIFEQRANRDYAQLLVLSLLLMTAAAISTASLIFGLLLFGYLLISLYCCLLFHLKLESEAAAAAMRRVGPGDEPIAAPTPIATTRSDERLLAMSMRRWTGLVAGVSITMAVLVFLFFPRGAPDEFFGRHFLHPAQVLTGFSEQVSMDQVASIGRSDQVVAEATVTENGNRWEGQRPLLLRGATLDIYTGPGEGDESPSPWSWQRSKVDDVEEVHAESGETTRVSAVGFGPAPIVQEITLHPTSSHVVFAVAGPQYLEPSQTLTLSYLHRDAILTTYSPEPLADGGSLVYTVRSNGVLPVTDEPVGAGSYIDPALRDYARQPDVSGTDEQGRSLAALRGTPAAPRDVDHRIAAAIERHLRGPGFQYTLDLTADATLRGKIDPMVLFLTQSKKGHCEYFAGAMTLMCQSLGIPARMVVGYRCDNFNNIGHFYIVQQSQAHAWVEVLTNPGKGNQWETFDPTSGNDAMALRPAGLLSQMKSLFNFLEYRWGTAVIAYGQQNRENLISNINQNTNEAVEKTEHSWPWMQNWLSGAITSPTPISVLVMLAVAALIGSVAYYIFEQVRLRRRTSRIGLARLPASEQKRLARQLGFYDDLLRLLAKRGITPRPDLTPQEFSDQLSFLPNQSYHDIRRLTRLFYRVRYGNMELTAHRRRRLDGAIARMQRRGFV